jgi:tubulin--tyrosine ligase
MVDECHTGLHLQQFLYEQDSQIKRQCLLTIHSKYVQNLLLILFQSRNLMYTVTTTRRKRKKANTNEHFDLQFCEYEEIDWDTVLSGDIRSRASCYCVRKGLTRKAALAQVCTKWVDKFGKQSILGRFVPETICISTWDAFSDDGGWLAKFGVRDRNLALSESLRDAEEWLENGKDRFVLKPSIANKGAEVTPVQTLQEVKEVVRTWQDCREWVLQRYVPDLLLLDGNRKFHLRVFIVCVGAIKVHLFKDYIGFFASSAFSADDHWAHITNAAHQRDHEHFDENKAFKLPHELASLTSEKLNLPYQQALKEFTAPEGKILSNLSLVIAETFRAFKTTPAVFQPHPNCFELFGLDFLVDEDLNTHLLEFNSGPDLDQAKGNRLSDMIENLIHGWFRLGVDQCETDNRFLLCYQDEWAFAQNSSQRLYE